MVYRGDDVEEEPDGDGAGGCRCRCSGARSSELRLQRGPLGNSDHRCVLEKAGGGVCWPELARRVVGDGGGAEENCDSLVALEAWCLGGMEEEEEGIYHA